MPNFANFASLLGPPPAVHPRALAGRAGGRMILIKVVHFVLSCAENILGGARGICFLCLATVGRFADVHEFLHMCSG